MLCIVCWSSLPETRRVPANRARPRGTDATAVRGPGATRAGADVRAAPARLSTWPNFPAAARSRARPRGTRRRRERIARMMFHCTLVPAPGSSTVAPGRAGGRLIELSTDVPDVPGTLTLRTPCPAATGPGELSVRGRPLAAMTVGTAPLVHGAVLVATWLCLRRRCCACWHRGRADSAARARGTAVLLAVHSGPGAGTARPAAAGQFPDRAQRDGDRHPGRRALPRARTAGHIGRCRHDRGPRQRQRDQRRRPEGADGHGDHGVH